jgi:hypothetical protein
MSSGGLSADDFPPGGINNNTSRMFPRADGANGGFGRLHPFRGYVRWRIHTLLLPYGQKIAFGLLTNIILETVPLPTLLPVFKCNLEDVLCVGVQHRFRFCLEHLNCVKLVGNREKGAKSGE